VRGAGSDNFRYVATGRLCGQAFGLRGARAFALQQ